LDRSRETWPGLFPTAPEDPLLVAAATFVRDRLASDGLLPTLARTIKLLDWHNTKPSPAAALAQLRAVGLPVDLIDFFSLPGQSGQSPSSEKLVLWIASQLASGRPLEDLCADLKTAAFSFQQTSPGFQLALEEGSSELKTIRIQLGGGYKDGILPGGNLDLVGRFCETLPDASVLLSVDEAHFEACHWLAAHVWPLRHTGQMTIISEPLPVSAWAQDNGKAGCIRSADGLPPRLACITPRFASKDDAETICVPGESFLMEGLRPAGLGVVQSPLLFQGGDLMAVRDPVSGRRVLLVGEGEISRNTLLGLTRAQVLEAFRVEMGLDEAVLWPEGSFHLDYDVTFRRQGDRSLAFVNDPISAARIIVGNGLRALETNGLITPALAASASASLQKSDYGALASELEKLFQARRVAGIYPNSIAAAFATAPLDSPTSNFQCFLTAVDFLLAMDPAADLSTFGAERAACLEAFRGIQKSLAVQKLLLEKRGWRIVPVPSMPDLHRGINYLNAVQDKTRLLMPAWGGFYANLDDAAAAAYREPLGDSVQIIPLQCAATQLMHGSIHCMLKAYPAPDQD
jgi:hypothetical protein